MNVVLSPGAKLPVRGTEFSAGLDLFAVNDGTVTNTPTLFDTGVTMEIPTAHVGQIWSRSGMAAKNYVFREAGLIDSDYRASVRVLLFTHVPGATYNFKAGDKIAQIVIVPCLLINPVAVESLTTTVRGEGGFGSTGR